MYKIILDTDFLIHSLNFKIDIFSELKRICDFPFKIYIIDKTIDELKNKKQEKLALNIIKKLNIIKTEKNKNVDNLILSLKNKFIVATQDKKLKKRLKENKIPIIIIRQKKYFKIENVL